MSEFNRLLGAAVTVLALLAWVAGLAFGIIVSTTDWDPDLITSPAVRYVMPGLTAVIGAVIAATSSLPDRLSRTRRHLEPLGKVLTASRQRPQASNTQRGLARLYVSVFLLGGLAAIGVWIWKDVQTLAFVKTVAAVWGGSVVGIVAAYLR